MNPKEVRVRIFISEYNLQGEDTAKVEKIANYVDNIMNRINSESPNQTEETIAVVSSLNIAEDYFKEKGIRNKIEEDYLDSLREYNQNIEELSNLLDQYL